MDTANQYSYDLETGQEDGKEYSSKNHQILSVLNAKYANSEFYLRSKYRLLHNDQRNRIREIDTDILEKIKSATT